MPLLPTPFVLAVLAVTVAGARAADEYVDARAGFRLEVPEGWTRKDLSPSGAPVHVAFSHPKKGERVQLSVRAFPESVVATPERAREMAVEATEGKKEYSKVRLSTWSTGGREIPTFTVDSRAEGTTLRVRQHYLAGNGSVFVLQSVAPAKDFEALRPTFEAIWATFRVVPPDAGRQRELVLRRLASRCGSEIDWAGSWDEASRRARESKRLVLVSVWAYPGFQITDQLMATTFMDEDVVELVGERFVAVRWQRGAGFPFDDPDVYGLSGTTFGHALLLATPDGQVVACDREADEAFLREHAGDDPDWPGPPAAVAPDPVEQVRIRLARGEVGEAEALLADADTCRALRLRASLHRRLLRGSDALDDLRRAREAADAVGLEADLDLDEAGILIALGHAEEARERIDRVLATHADHPRAPEARYALGAIELAASRTAEAEAVWNALVDELPESRWAWKAAATMTSTAYSVGKVARLGWPDPGLVAALEVPDFEPLPASRRREAEEDAVRFLLARQRPDGSWASETQKLRREEEPADDFELAYTAIAARALLDHRDEPGVGRAVESATTWILDAYAEVRAAGDEVYFMDYGVWSRAYLLAFVAEGLELRLRPEETLREVARDLVRELEEKQRPGGGWSYYVTRDLGGGADPGRFSMSFTTAAVVLAMLRAREAGLDVPERVLERGLDCLESMRSENGGFEYMLAPGGTAADRPIALAGAAGRGPVCALALLRGGRASRADLRGSLDLFVEHRGAFAKELGKALLHTGPQGQGSHYLLFDYAGAAEALAELPRGDRARYRSAVLEVLLAARTKGGGFVDNRPRGLAGSTGFALRALGDLRE